MDKCRNPECNNPAGIDPPGYCSRFCRNWQANTITRLRAELKVADRPHQNQCVNCKKTFQAKGKIDNVCPDCEDECL